MLIDNSEEVVKTYVLSDIYICIVVIIVNILIGLNLQLNDEDAAILQLSEYYKRKISKRGDLNWWDNRNTLNLKI
jgi:hypothetical protein